MTSPKVECVLGLPDRFTYFALNAQYTVSGTLTEAGPCPMNVASIVIARRSAVNSRSASTNGTFARRGMTTKGQFGDRRLLAGVRKKGVSLHLNV